MSYLHLLRSCKNDVGHGTMPKTIVVANQEEAEHYFVAYG